MTNQLQPALPPARLIGNSSRKKIHSSEAIEVRKLQRRISSNNLTTTTEDSFRCDGSSDSKTWKNVDSDVTGLQKMMRKFSSIFSKQNIMEDEIEKMSKNKSEGDRRLSIMTGGTNVSARSLMSTDGSILSSSSAAAEKEDSPPPPQLTCRISSLFSISDREDENDNKNDRETQSDDNNSKRNIASLPAGADLQRCFNSVNNTNPVVEKKRRRSRRGKKSEKKKHRRRGPQNSSLTLAEQIYAQKNALNAVNEELLGSVDPCGNRARDAIYNILAVSSDNRVGVAIDHYYDSNSDSEEDIRNSIYHQATQQVDAVPGLSKSQKSTTERTLISSPHHATFEDDDILSLDIADYSALIVNRLLIKGSYIVIDAEEARDVFTIEEEIDQLGLPESNKISSKENDTSMVEEKLIEHQSYELSGIFSVESPDEGILDTVNLIATDSSTLDYHISTSPSHHVSNNGERSIVDDALFYDMSTSASHNVIDNEEPSAVEDTLDNNMPATASHDASDVDESTVEDALDNHISTNASLAVRDNDEPLIVEHVQDNHMPTNDSHDETDDDESTVESTVNSHMSTIASHYVMDNDEPLTVKKEVTNLHESSGISSCGTPSQTTLSCAKMAPTVLEIKVAGDSGCSVDKKDDIASTMKKKLSQLQSLAFNAVSPDGSSCRDILTSVTMLATDSVSDSERNLNSHRIEEPHQLTSEITASLKEILNDASSLVKWLELPESMTSLTSSEFAVQMKMIKDIRGQGNNRAVDNVVVLNKILLEQQADIDRLKERRSNYQTKSSNIEMQLSKIDSRIHDVATIYVNAKYDLAQAKMNEDTIGVYVSGKLTHHEKHTHILKNKVQKLVACTQNLEEEIKIRKKQHAMIDEAITAVSMDQTSDFLKSLLQTRNSRQERGNHSNLFV